MHRRRRELACPGIVTPGDYRAQVWTVGWEYFTVMGVHVQGIFFTFARTRGQSFTSLDCNKNKKLKVNKQTKTDRSKMQKIRLVLFYAWDYNTCCARVYKLPTSNYYYYFLFSSVFLFLILIFFLRHCFLFTVIII